jgi:3-oxoacyl-[acyl-carrier protein] reductase
MDIPKAPGYSMHMQAATPPIALVTGASRGIGRACAEALAAQGFSLALQYRDKAAEANELAAKLGNSAQSFQGDLSQPGAAAQLVEKVEQAMGGPSVLVHAAGAIVEKPLMFLKPEEWAAQLELHAVSAWALSKAMLKHLRKTQWGRLVFIGSLAGEMGLGNGSAYAASKGALSGLAKSLALETARYGTTVNVIAPGYVDTDLTAAQDEEKRETKKQEIPLKRFGHAKEVAALVEYLCSPHSAFMTGQVLTLDGGMRLSA